MLENAYKNSHLSIVRDKESIYYHLLIYTSSDLKNYLDISYVYDKNDNLIGFRVHKLPPELNAALIVGDKRPGADQIIMFGDGNCNYGFIKNQPFDPVVLSDN
jgi:hypothetical protein